MTKQHSVEHVEILEILTTCLAISSRQFDTTKKLVHFRLSCLILTVFVDFFCWYDYAEAKGLLLHNSNNLIMYLYILQRLAIAKEFWRQVCRETRLQQSRQCAYVPWRVSDRHRIVQVCNFVFSNWFSKGICAIICMSRLYIEDLSQNKYSFCTKLLARNFVVVFFLCSSHKPHFSVYFFHFCDWEIVLNIKIRRHCTSIAAKHCRSPSNSVIELWRRRRAIVSATHIRYCEITSRQSNFISVIYASRRSWKIGSERVELVGASEMRTLHWTNPRRLWSTPANIWKYPKKWVILAKSLLKITNFGAMDTAIYRPFLLPNFLSCLFCLICSCLQ